MQKLIQGIHEFQNHIFSTRIAQFAQLAQGQNPQALFITCSDSRINPNLLTQTEPGDLFILRNAGNIVPPYGAAQGGEGATIEYAVTALGIRDIIVCGHSLCGAMQGLLNPAVLKNMPAVASWLSHAEATRRIMLEKYPGREGPAQLITAIEENVLVQIENLRTHPCVAAGLAQGKIKLHGWVYKIETGEVFAYQPQAGQFLPLVQESTGEAAGPTIDHRGTLTSTDRFQRHKDVELTI
jgi:carbonic anhydrase